ncbi:MAG: hypothetical protein AB7S52_02795 [Sphaerochaetaceae bacterium]
MANPKENERIIIDGKSYVLGEDPKHNPGYYESMAYGPNGPCSIVWHIIERKTDWDYPIVINEDES